MNFFLNCIISNFKKIIPKILILAVVLCGAMILASVVANFAIQKLNGDDFKINVGILSYDDDENMKMFINYVLKDEVSDGKFNIITVEDMGQGEGLLYNNTISALLIFPDDFLTSVINGKNYSPTLMYNTSDFITTTLVKLNAQSIETYFRSFQNSVYTVFAEINSDDVSNQTIFEVNMEYVKYIFEDDETFDIHEIVYSETLNLGDFYIFSFVIYILFLSSALFYDELNFDKNILFVKRISTFDAWYCRYYISRILLFFLTYLSVFTVFLSCLKIQISPMVILSLFNGAVLFISFQILIFNIFKSFISTVQLNFIVHTVFLFVSGGIIPSVMLPKMLSKIQLYTPMYHIRELISYGLTENKNVIFENSTVVVANIILISMIFLLGRKKVREAY